MGERSEVDLKTLLGEDYESFLKFKEFKEKKVQQTNAKNIATASIAEGGKYYAQYSKLHSQLVVIWEKAMAEARVQVGLDQAEIGPAQED